MLVVAGYEAEKSVSLSELQKSLADPCGRGKIQNIQTADIKGTFSFLKALY